MRVKQGPVIVPSKQQALPEVRLLTSDYGPGQYSLSTDRLESFWEGLITFKVGERLGAWDM